MIHGFISLGQNSEVEDFVNQIMQDEIPEEFEYYYLLPQSLKVPVKLDSLQNFQIRDLTNKHENFPINFYYQNEDATIDWRMFALNDAFILDIDSIVRKNPPSTKSVVFVKYNLEQVVYDSLIEHSKQHTILVRKKWVWNKNKIWKNPSFREELVKAWELNKTFNPEEDIYYEISKPLFSTNGQFAKVSIYEHRPCRGSGITYIYKKENEKWVKIFLKEFPFVSESSNCGGISIYLEE